MSNYVLSAITIQDLSQESIWIFVSDTITEILGWDPQELVGKSAFALVHPLELAAAKATFIETVRHDKAASLTVSRLRHRTTGKYVQCFTSITVAYNTVIGSISIATSGPRAMLKASTAQEVIVHNPAPDRFQFPKWSNNGGHPPRPNNLEHRLPPLGVRVGLILNRFSRACHIIYCTNDRLLSPRLVGGRSIYDFVTKQDEESLRRHIDMSRAGACDGNSDESCDGGYGYGRFTLLVNGRNSGNHADPSTANRRLLDESSGSGSSPSSASSSGRNDVIPVEAIFSAHSDGLVVILRESQ